ncbi:MAG: transglutaminase domain-containing protein [Syntrophomonadaceae bacterium]|nr:transglutaminase domain-containing protein [Syntrophomonadaceae bacterium]
MRSKKIAARLLTSILAALVIMAVFAAPSLAAAYSISFSTPTIQVASPSVNNTTYDKTMWVEGTSTLSKVWICLRGPNGELAVYPAEVKNGSFGEEIWLRFGTGKYTVWAGDNEKRFDGKIRFEIENSSREDYRNLAPSAQVNPEDQLIQKIADSIITEKMSDKEKARAIHGWVTNNISYDTTAYFSGNVGLNSAADIIASKKGLCRDFSFVYASLARAANIPTRVVYGDAWNSSSQAYEKHAWNESFIDGEWINIDTTWDAGYINSKQNFVRAAGDKYFNADTITFAKTHKVTSVTLF